LGVWVFGCLAARTAAGMGGAHPEAGPCLTRVLTAAPSPRLRPQRISLAETEKNILARERHELEARMKQARYFRCRALFPLRATSLPPERGPRAGGARNPRGGAYGRWTRCSARRSLRCRTG